MTRPISLFIIGLLSFTLEADPTAFSGRIEVGRDLMSFGTEPAVSGTLYLLSGSAGTVRVLSEEPFVAEVEFLQGEWSDEASLKAFQVTLRFEGEEWAKLVLPKKPRQDYQSKIYPYRRFQVLASGTGTAFRVKAVTLLL